MPTIEIGFDTAPSNRREFLEAVLSLPGEMRPERICSSEEDAGTPIRDRAGFVNDFERRDTGLILKSESVIFDVSLAKDQPIRWSIFADVDTSSAAALVDDLAAAEPLFGFACLPEERERRNLVLTTQGINSISTWVGRDLSKYIPGLYWITVLSDELLRAHGLALDELSRYALEVREAVPGQHVLRFYDRPEDWREASSVTDAIRRVDGIFDAEMAEKDLGTAMDFLSLSAAARKWR